MSAASVSVALPDDAVEAIARRAAEIVRESVEPASRWLTGHKAAADYLGWPAKRIANKIHELPHHQNGGRVMFSTRELDEYVRASN